MIETITNATLLFLLSVIIYLVFSIILTILWHVLCEKYNVKNRFSEWLYRIRKPYAKYIIKQYLRKADRGSLVFEQFSTMYSAKELKMPDNWELQTLVIFVLNNVKFFNSINIDGSFQCSNGSRRSSLDIWRHVKYYNADISLIDVMRFLVTFENHKDHGYIVSNFCHTVNRRVFRTSAFEKHSNEFKIDEYGLNLHDWRSL